MFIGHFAAAMVAKRAAPRISLGWLFAAAQLPDLLWPALLLMGVERARVDPGNTAFTPLAFDYYPWSHSLLMVAVWGGAIALLFHAVRTASRRESVVLAALVVSHWVLDWVTHRPDLPLVPGASARFGLGLWNSFAGTMVVEGVLFAGAVWLYSRDSTAEDRAGRWGWFALVAFLVAIDLANAFGPPPPNITTVAVGGFAIWLLVWWGAWADRHREAAAMRAAPAAAG